MPDAPTPPRPPVSVPSRPRPPRLPGTYAANYGDDPNWRRGVTVLWTIFILAALGEAVNMALYYLRGGGGNLGPLDALRLILEGALFLALWLGWGWLRWPLAAMNFFYSGWLVVWLIESHATEAAARAAAGEPAPSYGFASIPVFAMALVYLFSAGYLAFSADVLDFLRHRREEGRGWVAAPLAVLVGGYLMTIIFGAAFIYAAWLGLESKAGRDFTLQSLQTMSSPWDAAAYETLADPGYLNTWYQGDRKNVFASLAPLGAFKLSEHRHMAGATREDAVDGGFLVVVNCDLGQAQFAHGRAHFSTVVTRHLFGPWKMGAFQVDSIQMDAAPPAAR